MSSSSLVREVSREWSEKVHSIKCMHKLSSPLNLVDLNVFALTSPNLVSGPFLGTFIYVVSCM